MIVRRVLPQDWSRLRALRLQALADAPTAFGSTLAEETAFPDSVWQERAGASASRIAFIVERDGDWLGSITGLRNDDAGRVTITLVGVWVHPAARGQRLGADLITEMSEWARRCEATVLELWVTTTNAPAIALYERCGFQSTEERHPLPHTPTMLEMRMWRPLSGSASQQNQGIRSGDPGGLLQHGVEE